MQSYVTRFELAKYIGCSSKVLKISRTDDGKHMVALLEKTAIPGTDACHWGREDWVCDAVAVCSGINVHPNIPDIPGVHLTEKLGLLKEVSLDVLYPTALLRLIMVSASPRSSTQAATRTQTSSREPRPLSCLGPGRRRWTLATRLSITRMSAG
jgi:hypothetical protein